MFNNSNIRKIKKKNINNNLFFIKNKLLLIKNKNNKFKNIFLIKKKEFENIKYNFKKELKNIKKYSIENFVKLILDIKDNLEMTLNIKNNKVKLFKEGINLILKKLFNIFKNNNILEISPKLGEKLDPMKHQVISIIKSNKKNNIIMNIIQKGYMIYNHLLRPALVTVSKK